MSAGGLLTWTPAPADVGERQIKVFARRADPFEMLRLKTEVKAGAASPQGRQP